MLLSSSSYCIISKCSIFCILIVIIWNFSKSIVQPLGTVWVLVLSSIYKRTYVQTSFINVNTHYKMWSLTFECRLFVMQRRRQIHSIRIVLSKSSKNVLVFKAFYLKKDINCWEFLRYWNRDIVGPENNWQKKEHKTLYAAPHDKRFGSYRLVSENVLTLISVLIERRL